MTTMQNIALNKLVMSKANVRKTDRGEGLGELAASIAAHGLQQNLNVREGDKGVLRSWPGAGVSGRSRSS